MRRLLFQAVLICLLSASTSWARSGTFIAMTKNMDAGTDFGFFFAYLQTNPALGVQLTLEEFMKNDFPGRAASLAREIIAAGPHVVGLQEVTLLRSGPDPSNTPNVLVDQLQLLLDALAAQGHPYYLVGSQDLTDLAFPVAPAGAVRFTDRDAIIARADLPPSQLTVTDFHHRVYSTILSFSGLTVPRGWISANVAVGSNNLLFVATHLESSGGLYGNPTVDLIQAAQAAELAATFATSSIPVVIAADFNSNATHTPPEQTLSVGIMLTTGYTDAWSAVHRGIPGFTWPLYVEDPLRPHPKGPFERIDFIFSLGVQPASAERTGLNYPQSADHAGVVVIF